MKKKLSYFGYVLMGLFLFVVGFLFIKFNTALKTLVISIGIVLSVFGIIYGVLTIARKDRGFYFAIRICFSVICLACGMVTAIFHDPAAEYVASLFTLLLIVDGSFKVNTSAMAKRYNVGGWLIILVPSVLVIAGGYLLTKFPPQTAETVSILLGVLIIVDAIINILSAFFVPKFDKRMRREVIDEYEKKNERKKRKRKKKDALPEEQG